MHGVVECIVMAVPGCVEASQVKIVEACGAGGQRSQVRLEVGDGLEGMEKCRHQDGVLQNSCQCSPVGWAASVSAARVRKARRPAQAAGALMRAAKPLKVLEDASRDVAAVARGGLGVGGVKVGGVGGAGDLRAPGARRDRGCGCTGNRVSACTLQPLPPAAALTPRPYSGRQ